MRAQVVAAPARQDDDGHALQGGPSRHLPDRHASEFGLDQDGRRPPAIERGAQLVGRGRGLGLEVMAVEVPGVHGPRGLVAVRKKDGRRASRAVGGSASAPRRAPAIARLTRASFRSWHARAETGEFSHTRGR